MERFWTDVIANLEKEGVIFDQGLSDAEIANTENAFGFNFPPDLREFLQTALPISAKFPNWRSVDRNALSERLRWPADGICFDVEQNNLWLDVFGTRPDNPEQSLTLVRQTVASAPTLIPIYAHRFIPSVPPLRGNPVFSVYQSDIIYYGFDLTDYLSTEFKIPNPLSRPKSPRPIAFWDYFVS